MANVNQSITSIKVITGEWFYSDSDNLGFYIIATCNISDTYERIIYCNFRIINSYGKSPKKLLKMNKLIKVLARTLCTYTLTCITCIYDQVIWTLISVTQIRMCKR